jgi:hypothetical protein
MTRGGLETVSTESGTEGSNPALSSGESPANLSFRRIEVQGRSREADGDSRGSEHQGCAAVQQLTASPAADATERNESLARPEPLYECAADGPKEDFGRHGERREPNRPPVSILFAVR